MKTWQKSVVVLLSLLQVMFMLAFALLAYGHIDEVRRWSQASFSGNYSTRIRIEAVGCICNLMLTAVQLMSTFYAVRNLSGRSVGVVFLQLVPFVFVASMGLAIILWIVTPLAGNPHNDIARGLGSLILIVISLFAAVVAFFQDMLLRPALTKPR